MGQRVVVVGSLNRDIVITLERMPDSGETVFGSGLEQHAGGKGMNQAVAVARLGVPVAMIGALGDDAAGGWLRETLAREGIDETGVASVDGATGTAVIEVDAGGANRIVVIPGANATVTAEQVRATIAALADVSVVLTQGEVPFEAVAAAMTEGRARGAVTILNPAPALDLPGDVLKYVDYVIPNEHEAALITGLVTSTAVDATEAARALVGRGAGCAIVTRGSRGSVWATAQNSGSCAAFPILPVDTVAAGDAFCGGLSAALAEGRGLSEALRWGSATGALAATAEGAVTSLPSREAVERLLNAAD